MAAYMRLMRREEDFEERFREGYRYLVDRIGRNGTKEAAFSAVMASVSKLAHLVVLIMIGAIIILCCCDYRDGNDSQSVILYFGGASLRYSILRYMLCNARRNGRRSCPGRIIVYTNGDVRSTREHNHVPIPHEEDAYLFKFRLFQAVTTRFENARVIYDELAVLYPDGARTNTWGDAMKALIRRWRRQHRPPTPRSFDELSALLTDGDWRNALQMGRVSFAATAVGDVGHRSILLYDPQFVRQFETTEMILVDGTFGSVPRIDFVVPDIGGIAQLLVIMGQKYDTVMPLFYILMESRTRASYCDVFRHVRRVMPRLRPIMTMSDFEGPLMDSLKEVFPHAMTHGCYFHYVQALMRKTRRLVPGAVRNEEDAKLFLRRLALLALLPAENIVPTFNALCQELSPQNAADLQQFIDYYQRQWLQRVGPMTFSVCGLSRRTNNNCEAFNRILRDRMGRHPPLWIFLRNLLLTQSRMNNDLRSLQTNGRARFAPNVGFVMRNDILQDVWSGLAESRYTIPEALQIFSENSNDLVQIVEQHYMPQEDEHNGGELADKNGPHDAVAAAADVGMAQEPPANGPPAFAADPVVHDNFLDNEEGQLGGARVNNPGFPRFLVTDDRYERACVVCENEQSCILMLPCFHQVCCAGCTNLVVNVAEESHGRLTCPYCRTVVTNIIRPFMIVAPDGIGRPGEDVLRGVGRFANILRFSIRNDRYVHVCSICNVRESSILLLPCKHELLCTGCANNIVDIAEREHRRAECPLCDAEVEFAHRVMMPPQ